MERHQQRQDANGFAFPKRKIAELISMIKMKDEKTMHPYFPDWMPIEVKGGDYE